MPCFMCAFCQHFLRVFLVTHSHRLIVASKVNPFPTYGESLTPESVRAQAAASLAALDATSVDILYLHAPDVLTPIEVTLEGERSWLFSTLPVPVAPIVWTLFLQL